MIGDEVVHIDVERGVATITLDSPTNRNALSAQLRRELREQLESAVADPAVRVIVLTHTGTVFCAGMDLKESLAADARDQGVQEFPAILDLIWTSPKPVLARLTGPARAGGIGLVAACDIAIAVDTATFGFSEVRIGVIPAVISAPVLRAMPARAAQELFLTGETFDAVRAERLGLINRAVPAGEVDDEVGRSVSMILRGAPGALAGTKALTRRGADASLATELKELTALSARYFAGDEGQEGMRAFRDKREPAWLGTNNEVTR